VAISYINNMQTNSFPICSWKSLKKADRTVSVPFELQLRDQEHFVLCEKVIRLLPRKRLVAFGKWNDIPVVAKLFFERGKAKKHLQRDAEGIEALATLNIPTPKLLFKGVDKTKRIHVLLFERIMDSCNLDLLWQEKSDAEELTPLMRATIIELATQHVLGVVQNDLHLKNFLVSSKTIYTLDGGSIAQFHKPLSKKESLDHLGLFFAQLGVGTETLQQELFDLYAQSRGWIVRPLDREYLQQAINKWIRSRWERYQQKIMRNCSAFSRIEKWNALIMYDREYLSASFKKMLDNPDVLFTKSDTEILKSGRSATVAKVILDGRSYVIKRYNMKSVWHWFRRCLRPSRASASWRLAQFLRHAGIATAKPAAFIEKKFLGLRNKSYFIMEYIEGDDLGKFFSRYQANNPRYLQVAKRTMALIHQLFQVRMTHGDLKMTNILIHHDKPMIIDLDGMVSHKSISALRHAFKKEMQRFMKNWDSYPSVKEMFKELIE
jgi:tRNA A-37 threonylcarbamoyl transferase component Bud32